MMSNDHTMRLLPKAVQDFEELRQGGYVYVDKTDMVWRIANGDKFNFLSRPRRFGKSLLTSTLHYYFEGRSDLFCGLKIMDIEKEWPRRQVFHFDFSGCNTRDDLESLMNDKLSEYEAIYGRANYQQTFNLRFLSLMEKAYQQTGLQVAVLFDEYDSPLQHTLFNKEEHERMRDVYRSFFPVMKTGGKYIKCLFMTGITKFTQLSLFSTLKDITLLGYRPEYSTVCGITREEIVADFMPELEAMGKNEGWSLDDTLEELKSMYDGYHFSKVLQQGVFNPYSVINALYDGEISNYWASSGASSLLSEMLQHNLVSDDMLDGVMMDADTLERADVSMDNLPLFLYQSGYLTIQSFRSGVYILSFPNKEVRTALYKVVLPNALAKKEGEVNNSINRLKLALDDGNIEEAMHNVEQIVSASPYLQNNSEQTYEHYFRFIFEHIFFLAGCRVEIEKQMINGQIDVVVYHPRQILVMELKLDTNGGLEAAKQQLADRSYVSAFSAENKDIYAIAVSFSSGKHRGISGIAIEKQ